MIRYQLCYYLPHRSAVRSVHMYCVRQTTCLSTPSVSLSDRHTVAMATCATLFIPRVMLIVSPPPSSSCPSHSLRVTALIFSSITKIITVIPNKFSSMCFIQYVKGGEQRVSEAPRGEQERAFSSCDMPPALSLSLCMTSVSSYVMHMTLHFSSEPSRHS